MTPRNILILLLHAFVGWALCAATMGIGMSVTTIEITLIVHAIGAPLFFAGVSSAYVKKFNYTTPLHTAVVFLVFVVLVDFFVVALLIKKSLDMFTSLLGTWIPFTLIFASTYVTMTLGPKKGPNAASK